MEKKSNNKKLEQEKVDAKEQKEKPLASPQQSNQATDEEKEKAFRRNMGCGG